MNLVESCYFNITDNFICIDIIAYNKQYRIIGRYRKYVQLFFYTFPFDRSVIETGPAK